MTKNPIYNALAALAYIVAVSLFMFYGTQNLPKEDTVVAPIAALSLFTLSAAVMAYIFFYNPVLLFLEGKKKDALDLFLKTVGVFGAVTVTILTIYFSALFR
jgi:hypothetical protein